MRAPGAVVAEIVWRWTFGATFWVLVLMSFHQYFAGIEISPAEYRLIKSLEPYTWQAISLRVMIAFLAGLRALGPILIPALSVLWVALATVGRAITVRALAAEDGRTNWLSLVSLHVLRVLMLFAAILAFFGAGILVGTIIDPREHYGLNFLLMLVVLLVLTSIWSLVNWYASTAAIFAAANQKGFFASFDLAASLKGTRGVNFWFSLMRMALVGFTTFLSLIFAGQLLQGHRRLPLVAIAVTTILYFAVADLLYTWRLAAYIGLTEPEPEPPVLNQDPPVVPSETLESPFGIKEETQHLSAETSNPPISDELKADS
jgi:hypothetical protein